MIAQQTSELTAAERRLLLAEVHEALGQEPSEVLQKAAAQPGGLAGLDMGNSTAENAGNGTLTPTIRKRIWRAVVLTAGRAGAVEGEPRIPLYPDSVPDIDAHLELLARLVANAESGGGFTPRDVSERVCPACPHQFPNCYCPLRRLGGCMLYRFATEICQAVASAMDEPEPKADSFGAQEACHAHDAS